MVDSLPTPKGGGFFSLPDANARNRTTVSLSQSGNVAIAVLNPIQKRDRSSPSSNLSVQFATLCSNGTGLLGSGGGFGCDA